jgi:hypothetical protein
MDFDNDGEWDDDEQTSPAIHTPSVIKDIVVSGYHVIFGIEVDFSEQLLCKKSHGGHHEVHHTPVFLATRSVHLPEFRR